MVDSRKYPPYIRLAWSRPERPPVRPRPRVNLAHAIERHLLGDDGLTDDEFVCLHATGRWPSPPHGPVRS